MSKIVSFPMNKAVRNSGNIIASERRLDISDQMHRPLQDLRISVTDKCNFRCPYCMPKDKYNENYQFLRKKELLSFDEIIRLVRIYIGLGVKKVRLTGGEPLLRQNLTDLIRELRGFKELKDIALTTNGSLLADQAESLKAAGLDRVTVSLDSVNEQVFHEMTGGRDCLSNVLAGIAEAKRVGLGPVKVNTVVMKGSNDQDVLDLLEYFRGTGVIVRLVEYMDVGTVNQWERSKTLPFADLLSRIEKRWPLEPLDKNYTSEVADRYRYKDNMGEVGFINSVTKPFCMSCSRARLSANGRMYSCLFASGGLDLRSPLRDGVDDNELRSLIVNEWLGRKDRYSMDRTIIARQTDGSDRIEMFYIGG